MKETRQHTKSKHFLCYLSQKVRVLLAFALVAISLAVIGFSFWRQDWQYSLPTPRPVDLYQPPFGSTIPLPPTLARIGRPGHALFLHFLNLRCPCSQFNLEHIRFLSEHFSQAVDFVAVLQAPASAREAQKEYADLHLPIPMILDSDAQIGSAFGVYSTPQAVLLNEKGQLYFRGNYNVSRYCGNENTEFARLALTALLHGQSLPIFPKQAVIAYGCPLRRSRTVSDKQKL